MAKIDALADGVSQCGALPSYKMALPTKPYTMRATCWSVTAFNDEIERLEKRLEVPDYIKEIVGGVEACPDTGKLHFQGMLVCLHQVRMSKIKKWLPTAHLEICRNKEDLKKYVLKSETAVGPKVEWVSESGVHGFATSLMNEVYDVMIARFEEENARRYDVWQASENSEPFAPYSHMDSFEGVSKEQLSVYFDLARERWLRKKPEDLYRFMNPPFKRLWIDTAKNWFERVLAARQSATD